MAQDRPLTLPDWTVNHALLVAPAAAAVFNRFGIDTCCGGTQTLAGTACSVGVAPEVLAAALEPTVTAAI
jgi:iron-sulfur cluster repair protein YtfE (RIC family)